MGLSSVAMTNVYFCARRATHAPIASAASKGAFVDVQELIPALTLDIIVRTAFDCDLSAQRGDAAATAYLTTLSQLAHGYFDMFQTCVLLAIGSE